jgi:hypothetical protein
MATYLIPAPEPMNCNGNVATLKSLMGIECKKILKRLQLSEADMKDPAVILAKLQDHFVPVRNILYERYIFHNTEQQVHETIDQFLIKLRQLAEPCNFGTLEDEMVRDRLVLGCRDSAPGPGFSAKKIALSRKL